MKIWQFFVVAVLTVSLSGCFPYLGHNENEWPCVGVSYAMIQNDTHACHRRSHKYEKPTENTKNYVACLNDKNKSCEYEPTQNNKEDIDKHNACLERRWNDCKELYLRGEKKP